MAVWLYDAGKRRRVPSLAPYLQMPLDAGIRMDRRRMPIAERSTCPWVNFGILKGVTHPKKRITVIPVCRRGMRVPRGLHAELIQGMAGVDPPYLCYDRERHVLGFGGYIRWVYFVDPNGGPGFLGIDFSLVEPARFGVAMRVEEAGRVMRVAMEHGIPAEAGGVLLNWRMCEVPGSPEMREGNGFLSVGEWANRCLDLVARSHICPRCGLKRRKRFQFCPYCGRRFKCNVVKE